MNFGFGFDTGELDRGTTDRFLFAAIVACHRSHVAMGLSDPDSRPLYLAFVVAWMSPTILGLLLAIFLSLGQPGGRSIGLALRRAGLLLTPEEQMTPPVVARANFLAGELPGATAKR